MSGWWVLWVLLLSFVALGVFFATNLDAMEAARGKPGLPAFDVTAIAAFVGMQLIQFVILAILPGQDGDNAYGPDPRMN